MSVHIESKEVVGIRDTIKRTRLACGVNQETIARVVGINREIYNRWERGRKPIDDRKIILMAGFLLTILPPGLDREELIQATTDEITKPQVLQLRKSLRIQLSFINRLEREAFHSSTHPEIN